MINIQALEFHYPGNGFTLDIDAFTVSEGEKVAVIGPSGSGKTTLLNLASGIIKSERGSIAIADTQIDQLSDAQRRDFRINNIGFVFQDFELIEYLNVMDNIIHPYRITRSLRLTPSVRQRAIQLAEKIGISDKLHRYANDLSQGEKQRVAICRALLPGPKLVFADEATGNLDPRNKGRILDLLFDNVAEHGTTMVAVTHDHELLPRFDRVVDFLQFRAQEPA
jgi:putative ABC transport system ATP-binding protein